MRTTIIRRWTLGIAVLVLVADGTLPALAQDAMPRTDRAARGGATPAAVGPGLDLAAMTLTPLDLPMSGFGLGASTTWTIEQEAVTAAGARSADPGAFAEQLRGYGWLRRYLSSLEQPATPGEPQSLVAIRIQTGVTEYADAAGAARGFALLEDESALADSEDVTGTRTFGDESEITRSIYETPDVPGLMVNQLNLTMRLGKLVADVILQRLDDTEAEVPVVEDLAALLQSRVESVQAGGGPGLSLQVLRPLGPGAAVPDVDGYLIDQGRILPFFNESAEELADRESRLMGVVHGYELQQAVGADFYYVGRLYRFAAADQVGAWMEADFDDQMANPEQYRDLAVVADAPSLGDRSVVVSYAFALTETDFVSGYIVYASLGETGVRIQFDHPAGVSLDALAGLVEIQLACLTAGSRCDNVSLPDDLVASGPPAPVDPPGAARLSRLAPSPAGEAGCRLRCRAASAARR